MKASSPFFGQGINKNSHVCSSNIHFVLGNFLCVPWDALAWCDMCFESHTYPSMRHHSCMMGGRKIAAFDASDMTKRFGLLTSMARKPG